MENNDTKWKVLDREYIIKRPWLTARRDKVELPDGRIIEEYYVLDLTHCFLAVGVEKISEQSLDATEELTVHLMGEDEIKSLLENDQIYQALMVAPLYKYFSDKK